MRGLSGMGQPVLPAYAIAKAGLTALTRHVTRRWGKKRIRANCVLPGLVLTESAWRGITAEAIEEVSGFAASHRLGIPADIAAMVAMLFSEMGSGLRANPYLWAAES
jgi:NAD(P)-dependent dehydrogenase (short-subunit alcohol dehydrogenase family)